MDYTWVFKQLIVTTLGTSIGFVLGKFFTKFVKNEDDAQKKVAGTSDYHIALIVNSSLKMGKGKVAAQCGHSVVGVLDQARKMNLDSYSSCSNGDCNLSLFKVASSDDFKSLKQEAKKRSVINYLVADAGRTQIQRGSLTVLGIGPASGELIQEIVDGLEPY